MPRRIVPGERSRLAEQEANQGRLARGVGADDPHLVAAHDRRRQVPDHGVAAVAEAHSFGLDDQGARSLGLLRRDSCRALALAPFAALLAHRLERADAAFVAGAPGLDPFADPHFFLGQPLVEELLLPGLGVQDLVAALEERRIVAGPVVELAAVELDDPRRQLFQEHPVVGDEDQGAAGTRQEGLEPADGVDIEVVGRLVQQQDIGLG